MVLNVHIFLKNKGVRDLSQNTRYIECKNFTVVDIDKDGPLSRRILEATGSSCNLIAFSPRGVHLYFRGATTALAGFQGHGVDIRTWCGSANKRPDIIFCAPTSYGTPHGIATYTWFVQPAGDIFPPPNDLVLILKQTPNNTLTPHMPMMMTRSKTVKKDVQTEQQEQQEDNINLEEEKVFMTHEEICKQIQNYGTGTQLIVRWVLKKQKAIIHQWVGKITKRDWKHHKVLMRYDEAQETTHH
eukprot:PhM_4_TR10041/c1_g1_i3/m.99256